MAPRAARRRASPHVAREIEQEPITPDEIDALTDASDDHDDIIERLERVETFRSAGSLEWVGPED